MGQSGQVGEEQQSSLWGGSPPPLGDVLEEDAQVDQVVVDHRHPDGLAVPVGTPPRSVPCPCQERLYVAAAVELIQTGDFGMFDSEPVARTRMALTRI